MNLPLNLILFQCQHQQTIHDVNSRMLSHGVKESTVTEVIRSNDPPPGSLDGIVLDPFIQRVPRIWNEDDKRNKKWTV